MPETYDLPGLYRAIFEDDTRGAAILADLESRFGGVSVHTSGGVDAILKTYHSASQAAVVGYILKRINQANDAPGSVGIEDPEGNQ